MNNREAGDLRRHRAHYDVIVMFWLSRPIHSGRVYIGRPVRWIIHWWQYPKLIICDLCSLSRWMCFMYRLIENSYYCFRSVRVPFFGCEKLHSGLLALCEGIQPGHKWPFSLQWCHYELDDVSSHQSHDCLLNRYFRRRSKKTPKIRVTGLCEGNSPVTGEFPAQRASNAENVSSWWRHHILLSDASGIFSR